MYTFIINLFSFKKLNFEIENNKNNKFQSNKSNVFNTLIFIPLFFKKEKKHYYIIN